MKSEINMGCIVDIFADIKKDTAPSGEKDDRSALFAEINKGSGITSKLKKVTADMQTHKNPNLRAAVSFFKCKS